MVKSAVGESRAVFGGSGLPVRRCALSTPPKKGIIEQRQERRTGGNCGKSMEEHDRLREQPMQRS